MADTQAVRLPVANQKNASGLGPNPQIGVAILEEFDDGTTFEARRVAFVKNLKLNSIKPRQAIAGADPEIAIPSLGHCNNRTLRWMDSSIWTPDIYCEMNVGFSKSFQAANTEPKPGP